jgi:hypothetical protein
MDNKDFDKLTKDWMSDSKLNISNPIFDDLVMKQILVEASKQNERKTLLTNILIFTGIELVIFAFLFILLIYFNGSNYFTSAIKSSLQVFQHIGNLAIRYDYLILSFIIVGILDRLMNKKTTVSARY